MTMKMIMIMMIDDDDDRTYLDVMAVELEDNARKNFVLGSGYFCIFRRKTRGKSTGRAF
jgi:hypothetical protein